MLRSKFVVGDIETTVVNGKHVPVFMGLKIDDNCDFIYQNFNLTLNSKAIKDFIFSMSCFGKIIYFHNLSSFDGVLILEMLSSLNMKSKTITKNSNIYSISFETVFGKVILRDSYTLIPFSLKEAALFFNQEHKKSTFDFDDFNSYMLNSGITRHNLESYLHEDLSTLFELVHRFNKFIIELMGLSIDSSITLSSLSQHCFIRY